MGCTSGPRSLTWSQILLVLQKLPDKLCDLVAEDDAVQIGALWKVKLHSISFEPQLPTHQCSCFKLS